MWNAMWNFCVFFFSSRRRHTRWTGDWSSDVCSSDLPAIGGMRARHAGCQRQAGERNVGNEGIGGIGGIDRDVGIAAAGREAKILRRGAMVGAPPVREP